MKKIGDLIYRQDVLDALSKCHKLNVNIFDSYEINIEEADYMIEHLPPAQLECKKGKWIEIKYTFHHKCSNCEWINNTDSGYNFCPNCGVYMRGEEDEVN